MDQCILNSYTCTIKMPLRIMRRINILSAGKILHYTSTTRRNLAWNKSLTCLVPFSFVMKQKRGYEKKKMSLGLMFFEANDTNGQQLSV